MRMYLAMLVGNAVLVSAMVADWMNPLYRVAMILIAVVALGALIVRDRAVAAPVVEEGSGRHRLGVTQ